MLRFILILLLIAISILEVGPIPLTPLLLLWIVLFRPLWFYDLVLKIYDKK
jgi:hypothetical protein